MITAEVSAVSINKYSDMPIESSVGNLQFGLGLTDNLSGIVPDACALIASGQVPENIKEKRQITVGSSGTLKSQSSQSTLSYNTYVIARIRIRNEVQQILMGPNRGTYNLPQGTYEYDVVLLMTPPKAASKAPKESYESSVSVEERWNGGGAASGQIIIRNSTAGGDVSKNEPVSIDFSSYPEVLDLKTFGEQDIATIRIANAREISENTNPSFTIIPVNGKGVELADGFQFVHDKDENEKYSYSLNLRSLAPGGRTYSASARTDIPVDEKSGGGLFGSPRYKCNYIISAVGSPAGYDKAKPGTYSSWIKVELKQP